MTDAELIQDSFASLAPVMHEVVDRFYDLMDLEPAYAELRAEGYLSAHAGRGTFVSRDVHPASSHAHHSNGHESQEDFALPDSSLRDMMRLARRPGVINFSHGSPPFEFFPMSALRSVEALSMTRKIGRAHV